MLNLYVEIGLNFKSVPENQINSYVKHK